MKILQLYRTRMHKKYYISLSEDNEKTMPIYTARTIKIADAIAKKL